MENALLLGPNGTRELKNIYELIDALGDARVRTERYECCGNKEGDPTVLCRLPVFPAISEEYLSDRVYGPAPYFRCGGRGHIPLCNKGAHIPSRRPVPPKNQLPNPGSQADRDPIPARFDDPLLGAAQGVQPVAGAGNVRPPRAPSVNTSEATVSTVPSLVVHWKGGVAAVGNHRLTGVRDCPGKTYSTVFFDLARVASRRPNANHRYIYWGAIKQVQIYGKKGAKVIFADAGPQGEEISAFFENAWEPATRTDHNYKLLQGIARGGAAVAYLLGNLVYKGGRLEIVATTSNHVYLDPVP